MRSPISELNTQEKIREKINAIEEASGQKMNSAAKKIIEQHVLGDMMKRMTNLYALMAKYSPERGSMSIKVWRLYLIFRVW
jgi:DNA polymerase III delta prime subunit